ncbi:hypothetical protein ACELLULO517_01070 [Acidisoma cellulosilytica]|uniref:Uncharacterized protein n=1 Tax=Acidisoma cellulosilyticum TaxID=2802395 RepID=A0A964E2G5_9PROT|nr:hypothetical protein [Acidisoma cellulosilyticum]MCB8878808.1 hypothetical protein [Acidisoma cellulosilyticum]
MIKPFTCICLALAAGSGLYLYQVKQRAFALDASLRSTFHDIDMAREKTRMLRADWALMNDPERLQALSDQYLTLKPMGPSQLMTLDQLAVALPAPIPPGTKTAPVMPDIAAPATDPTHGVPMASNAPATPSGGASDGTAVAMLQPVVPAPAATSDAGADTAASDADAPAIASNPAPTPNASPNAALKAAAAASVAASASAAVAMAHAAPPSLAKVAVSVPRVTHHYAKHVQPAVAKANIPQDGADSSLADNSAASPAPKPHHATHHSKPTSPSGTQYFAANDATHPAYGSERITPRAATVMYTPVGSSLGMASAATLAPPRPLYSSTQ